MTGQDVINAVSQDVRSVLGTTGTAQVILQSYVDRIQKDILHDSIYSYLNDAFTTITTVVDTTNYNLPVDVRAIKNVYDRTRERLLLPMQATTAPVAMTQPSPVTGQARAPELQMLPRELFRLKTVSTGEPEYWQMIGTNTLYFYATPKKELSVEVAYNKQVATVTDPTVTLTVPGDAIDMAVSGVNYLANLFLGREAAAQTWLQLYGKLKAGESLA